jgi:hypothetical protein
MLHALARVCDAACQRISANGTMLRAVECSCKRFVCVVGAHTQEISMLAGCRCPNITEYYTALLKPGTTELLIVMELMACSIADLVRVCIF